MVVSNDLWVSSNLPEPTDKVSYGLPAGHPEEVLTDLRGYEIWEVRGKRLVIKRDVDHQSDYPDN